MGWLVTLLLLAWPLVAAPVVLQNDRLALAVDAETGAVISLRDRRTGRELLASGAAPRLFQAEFTPAGNPAGERQWATERDAGKVTVTAAPERLTITLAGEQPGLRAAEVVFSTAEGDPSIEATITVHFDEALRLQALRFPLLTLAIGDDAALVTGSTKGGLSHPAAWPTGRTLAQSQPGNLAAPFLTCHDAAGGLVLAARDGQARPKTFTETRTEQGLDVQVTTPGFAPTPYTPGYHIALSCLTPRPDGQPADWHDAADLYKIWALTQPWCATPFLERTDLPQYLREGPTIVRFNRSWLAEPDRVRDWIRDTWQALYPSAPLIAAEWGWEKVDTWITPDYFPAYPSDEAFTALNGDLLTAGVIPFCWPSGYHYTLTYQKRADGSFAWDDRARFEREIRPHAIRNAAGEVLLRQPSWLAGGETATLCPGDPWVIDWFKTIGAELARRGSPIVQVDQVVGGRFPACWSSAHGHPPGPGLWQTEVFHEQLDKLADAIRAQQPEGFVCVEEPNEVFIQQVGLQDYRDWEALNDPTVTPAAVFPYLYHEFLPCFQSNPRLGDRVGLAWQIATGQMPHLIPSATGPALTNASLDTWQGAAPQGWEKVAGWQGVVFSGMAERDTIEKQTGEASLKLVNGPDDPVVQVSQNVRVGQGLVVGQRYRLRAWLRNGGQAGPSGIQAACLAPGLKSLGGVSLPFGVPEAGWLEQSAEFTVPEGTELLRIMINLSHEGTGWVDNLQLEEPDGAGGWQTVMRPATPVDYDLTSRWVQLYHGDARAFLAYGRMLPPPALSCGTFRYRDRDLPAIFHNAFEAADGRRAVVLVNATGETQTGTLTVGGQPQPLRLDPWEIALVPVPV